MTTAVYDLRSFFRTVGAPAAGAALMSEPVERADMTGSTEMVDDNRAKVDGPPLAVQGFIDGVQSSVVVSHREHRPIYLTWQAAGAVGAQGRLLGLKERLTLVCSTADRAWVDGVNTMDNPLPVQELPPTLPFDLERAAYATVGDWRDRLERALVEELVDAGTGPLVVDGSLRDRPHHPALHAVVKDVTSTRYLPDEQQLFGLPAGWRSPIFKLAPGGRSGGPVERYSCYVRLHDARHRGWAHGLIRIEAFSPESLEPLAALAMAERQGPLSGDGRWDRHLGSVAITEKVLRSRRPVVFDFAPSARG